MILDAANIVITANHFNPSIFNQLWLVKNHIMGEDDFEGPGVFVESVSQVEGREFRLLVIPPQLQFLPRVEIKREQSIVEEKLGQIVAALPHTPYAAVGLNFIYRFRPESVPEFTRKAFCRSDRKVFQSFDAEDAHFGAYMSKDWHGMRLKLDIKPITRDEDGTQVSGVAVSFNFHRDLVMEDRVAEIKDCLAKWGAAKAQAELLSPQIEEGI
jgi:hypothetical protein